MVTLHTCTMVLNCTGVSSPSGGEADAALPGPPGRVYGAVVGRTVTAPAAGAVVKPPPVVAVRPAGTGNNGA